jgi:hypothetical protein
MFKKHKRLFLLLLALLALGSIWIVKAVRPSPTFVYGLEKKDAAEIESAIDHAIWLRLCPDHSWTSIKGLPHAVKTYFSHHIQAVSGDSGAFAEVNVRYHSPGKSLHAELFTVAKTPQGWRVMGSRVLVN